MEFNPFKPLAPDLCLELSKYTGNFSKIARYLSCNENSCGILIGPIGVGKSTLLKAFKAKYEKSSYKVIHITCRSQMTPKAFLKNFGKQLGYKDSESPSKLGLKMDYPVQQIGDVSESESNTFNQNIVQVDFPKSSSLEGLEIGETIHDLVSRADLKDKKILFIVDQLEHLQYERRTDSLSLVDLVEGLCYATDCYDIEFSFLTALREEWTPTLTRVSAAYGWIPERLVMVNGISRKEASKVLDKLLEWEQISFSKNLKNKILDKLSDRHDFIWPLAFHAVCLAVVTKTKTRNSSKASLNDFENIGKVEKLIADSIVHNLRPLTDSKLADFIYVLNTACVLQRREGEIVKEQLVDELIAYDLETVQTVLEISCNKGLLEANANKNWVITHDMVESAISIIRAELSQESSNLLDSFYEDWLRSGLKFDETMSRRLEGLDFVGGELPLPHYILVYSWLFRKGEDVPSFVVSHIKEKPEDLVLKSCKQLIKRSHDFIAYLAIVKILISQPNIKNYRIAISFLKSLVKRNDEVELQIYLKRALTDVDIESFANLFFSEKHDENIILTKTILSLSASVKLNHTLLKQLWLKYKGDCPEEIIANIADDSIELEIVKSAILYEEFHLWVRAFSKATLKTKINCQYLVQARILDCPSADICTLLHALPPQYGEDTIILVKQLFEESESSLIREACVEIASKFCNSEAAHDLVFNALDDESYFVRESAVYAASHLEGVSNKVLIKLGNLTLDSSNAVKEAAIRVMKSLNSTVSEDSLLGGLKSNEKPLNIAALDSLVPPNSDDIVLCLKELIENSDNSLDVRLKALKSLEDDDIFMIKKTLLDIALGHSDSLLADVISVLQRIKLGEEEYKKLLVLASHPSSSVRERLVYLYTSSGDKRSGDWLGFLARDQNDSVKARAIYGLGRIKCFAHIQYVKLYEGLTNELGNAVKYYLEVYNKEKI